MHRKNKTDINTRLKFKINKYLSFNFKDLGRSMKHYLQKIPNKLTAFFNLFTLEFRAVSVQEKEICK